MADNTIVLNGNYAPFVEDEYDAGEGSIQPGHALDVDANGDVIRHSGDPSVNTEAVGNGIFADVSRSDPSLDKADAYPNGDRVTAQYVPVGGKVDAFIAAGGDLGDGTRANVDTTDVLEEVADGALAAHDGADTTGDGTGAAVETVYETGALYKPLEAVDNSGAAAGEQARIEVVRIA
jgi:hypothetical protein